MLMRLNMSRERVSSGPQDGSPLEAPVSANAFLPARGPDLLKAYQHTHIPQPLKRPDKNFCQSQLLNHKKPHRQQQQQMERHIIRPTAMVTQKYQEPLQQPHLRQPVRYSQSTYRHGACSRSNSSLATTEERSLSQHVSGKLPTQYCSKGAARCVCHCVAQAAFTSRTFNRISYRSTRSNLGPSLVDNKRDTIPDLKLNVSTVVDASGDLAAPPPVSPSAFAAVPSTTLSVGGESCTDWGTISADDSSCCNGNGSNVYVAVRVRPLSETERIQGDMKTVSVLDSRSLTVTEVGAEGGPRGRRVRKRYFSFDSVFGETTDQEEVFQGCTLPLLHDLLKGINVSVFAYGATAAGKTHTMLGSEAAPGVMPRALQLLFQQVCDEKEREFSLSCSFVEIYNETIRDLLGSRTDVCELREDPEKGMVLQHATIHRLRSKQHALLLLLEGNDKRTQEATNANQTSSRSHAILQVNILARDRSGEESQLAKLSLVDLAGSERASHTSNHGQRMTEGASINRSLLALGNVINALTVKGNVSGKASLRFVPYRDSKLTRLLKDSLGGRCRTAMVATISPAISHQEETLNTLKYAKRAKAIRNSSDRARITRLQGREAPSESAAVAGLKAKLHQLQCQISRQDLHERLHMRKRLHAGQIMSLLDASEEPEARQGLNTKL
ncbi:kinesin motor domain-containing protein, putative [Eimeria necatrix]|uniref:Kinesin-like protein n=1 Tax=Eimeria necatrix TaxID=51315 RepID=U6MRM8_9EIME|nr:kinesin motor domain-containing protein, putative [Eimeria necatrix]CDJ66656.1 kinesin motor domain-containing protein, putative [Eimeria necatrix]